MRAKRSKKYRKIMNSYQIQFSFRTPYQVLCDSNFLRQCHAFHMPIQKFLTNTLHGDAHPYITQCSLAKAIANHKGKGRGDGKPLWLPLPTEVPLRYCKHKDEEGNEKGVVDEVECLVDLVAGQPKGNEVPKNKNHYVLATAEGEEDSGQRQDNPRKRKRGVDVREAVRRVPGVPIVYVKRSVMVLEELSGTSERVIRGAEQEKFRSGLIGNARGLKRPRDGEGDEDDEDNDETENGNEQTQSASKGRGHKKAKGPNPLSMRKKKARPPLENTGNESKADGNADGEDEGQKKKRRRRRHGAKGEEGVAAEDGNAEALDSTGGTADQVEV